MNHAASSLVLYVVNESTAYRARIRIWGDCMGFSEDFHAGALYSIVRSAAAKARAQFGEHFEPADIHAAALGVARNDRVSFLEL